MDEVSARVVQGFRISTACAMAVGSLAGVVTALVACGAAVFGMEQAGGGLLDLDVIQYGPLCAAVGGAIAGGTWAQGGNQQVVIQRRRPVLFDEMRNRSSRQ